MGGLYGFMLWEAFPYYGPHKPFFISTVGQYVSPWRQQINTLSEVQVQLRFFFADKIKRPNQKCVSSNPKTVPKNI